MNIILIGDVATGKSEVRNWLVENLRYKKPHIYTTNKEKFEDENYTVCNLNYEDLENVYYVWKHSNDFYWIPNNDLLNYCDEDNVYIFDSKVAYEYISDCDMDEEDIVVIHLYSTDQFSKDRLKKAGYSDEKIDSMMLESAIENSLVIEIANIINSLGHFEIFNSVEFAGDVEVTCMEILNIIKEIGD